MVYLLDDFLGELTNPVFVNVLILCNALAFLCWIATLLTDNYSHVDRLWSILPGLYAWIFLFNTVYIEGKTLVLSNRENLLESLTSAPNANLLRLVIMTTFITLWGSRLTYNFWRKGGYSLSNEDYRWIHVKKGFGYPKKKVPYHIFNLVFTAFFQHWLLLGLALPIWYMSKNKLAEKEAFNRFDLAATLAFLFFFMIEIIADQQQWKFQTNKYIWLENPSKNSKLYSKEEVEAFKRGFLVTGLFKYSRHPNFFGEISIWWCIYFFTLSSQWSSLVIDKLESISSLVNYTIFGTFVLTLLFQGSTYLTEQISISKYKKNYVDYQANVSRLIPFFSTYNPNKQTNQQSEQSKKKKKYY